MHFVLYNIEAKKHGELQFQTKPPLKRLGLVSSASSEFKKIAEEYASPAVIGHVRYSTMGRSSLENAQPLKVKDLCVAHNGTIANVQELSNLGWRMFIYSSKCK